MKILSFNEALNIQDNLIITLGAFDGLHNAHLKLVDKTSALAKKSNYKSAMLSIDFSEYNIKSQSFLTTVDRKKDILENKLDYLIVLKFTEKLKHKTSEQFIDEYLKKLNITDIVVGYNFKLGSDKDASLKHLKLNYNVHIIDNVKDEEATISSTRIRNLLSEGNIKSVTSLLNRYYSISGHVISGNKLGSTIGFPTANVNVDDVMIPSPGVYQTCIKYNDKILKSITNVGYNPTVKDDNILSVETFILDFNQTIYNEFIRIYFISKIRDEKKFDSLDSLKRQISTDVQSILKLPIELNNIV